MELSKILKDMVDFKYGYFFKIHLKLSLSPGFFTLSYKDGTSDSICILLFIVFIGNVCNYRFFYYT